jgi:putative endonuclease
MYYVYVLIEQQTGNTYIGYSSNLKRRIASHQAGTATKVTRKGQWHLAYYEAYLSSTDATARERRLKDYGNSRTHLFARIKNSINCVKLSAGGCGHR